MTTLATGPFVVSLPIFWRHHPAPGARLIIVHYHYPLPWSIIIIHYPAPGARGQGSEGLLHCFLDPRIAFDFGMCLFNNYHCEVMTKNHYRVCMLSTMNMTRLLKSRLPVEVSMWATGPTASLGKKVRRSGKNTRWRITCEQWARRPLWPMEASYC